MVCGLALALSACTALADAAVPYKDTNVAGTIGLCDRTGKAIHHGKVSDGPFVWLAASSSPARAPYDGYGKSATLYAYQPLQGSPPEDWRGYQLTASTSYGNPATPTVEAIADDGPQLKEFMKVDPPQWNGLIQLRIYLAVLGQPVYNATYPATDIQVKGDTWTVVRGGNVACDPSNATLQPSLAPPSPASPGAGARSPSSSPSAP